MKQVWRRRPSAALVVAMIALVVAASGTAIAAGHLSSGDNLIRKDSLSGDRLRRHTLNGNQINVNKLGTVPKAANALHAGDADRLGGKPASAYLAVGGSTRGRGRGPRRRRSSARPGPPASSRRPRPLPGTPCRF